MYVQFWQVLRAILQVGPGACELHISTQLTNITRALIKQQGPEYLRFNMDVRSNTTAFGRKEGANQLVAFHYGALMQAWQVDSHGNTPPECWQQRRCGVFCRRGQQQQ